MRRRRASAGAGRLGRPLFQTTRWQGASRAGAGAAVGMVRIRSALTTSVQVSIEKTFIPFPESCACQCTESERQGVTKRPVRRRSSEPADCLWHTGGAC